MKQFLVVLNQDKRLEYLINQLKKDHGVMIAHDQEEFEKLIKESQYTHLLLPITGVDNNLTIRGGNTQLTEEILGHLRGKTILTGLVHESLSQACQHFEVELVTYMTDDFAIDNNYITCEGIIEALVKLSEKAIYQSNILILGYGRLGQILTKVLAPFKVNLWVAARDDKDLTKIKIEGNQAIHLNQIEPVLKEVDFMITTIPKEVMSHALLERLVNQELLILDVSSHPYSFDHDYAKNLGLNVHLLPKIPGRIAPKTSGELLATYISLL
jgi:dipicolinate synthase subunit A